MAYGVGVGLDNDWPETSEDVEEVESADDIEEQPEREKPPWDRFRKVKREQFWSLEERRSPTPPAKRPPVKRQHRPPTALRAPDQKQLPPPHGSVALMLAQARAPPEARAEPRATAPRSKAALLLAQAPVPPPARAVPPPARAVPPPSKAAAKAPAIVSQNSTPQVTPPADVVFEDIEEPEDEYHNERIVDYMLITEALVMLFSHLHLRIPLSPPTLYASI